MWRSAEIIHRFPAEGSSCSCIGLLDVADQIASLVASKSVVDLNVLVVPAKGMLTADESVWSAGCVHLVPQPAVQVDVVAVGLTGSRIADVHVQGMTVIRGLQHAA